MTNFEKIKSLSLEEMAELNVQAFIYNSGYHVKVDYNTTDGNIFGTRDEAKEYEKSWLQQNVDEDVFEILDA